VQNNGIICLIGVMFVFFPIIGMAVYFHISRPHFIVDFYFRIEKVGTGIGVVHSGVNYFN
jgi:hypothetical protein